MFKIGLVFSFTISIEKNPTIIKWSMSLSAMISSFELALNRQKDFINVNIIV